MAETKADSGADTATSGAGAETLNSTLLDVLKQIGQITQQAILQLQTQAQTSAQMAGQRADRTDVSTVDVGGDETKKTVTAAQALRAINPTEAMNVEAFLATNRTQMAMMNSNMITNCHAFSQLVIATVLKGNENLLGVNMTDVMEAIVGNKVAEEAAK